MSNDTQMPEAAPADVQAPAPATHPILDNLTAFLRSKTKGPFQRMAVDLLDQVLSDPASQASILGGLGKDFTLRAVVDATFAYVYKLEASRPFLRGLTHVVQGGVDRAGLPALAAFLALKGVPPILIG
jgi:hypothetical protein